MYKSIYVPVDNSDHSNRAVACSVELGKAFSAKLVGCHVYAAKLHDYRFRQMEYTLPEEYIDEVELERQRKIHDSLITMGLKLISDSYLDGMSRLCKESNLEFEPRMMDGKHHAEILKDLDGSEHDLVVIGALGIGRATSPLQTRTGLDPDELTLADLLPVSSAVGKWHLSDPYHDHTHPLQCGFDDFLGTLWNLAPPPMDGPEYWDWRKYDALGPPVHQTEYATEVTTDDALARLGQLNQEAQPWLLYVAYHAAHTPFHCPPGGAGSFPCPTDWWSTCGALCTYLAPQTCRVSAVVQALDHHLGRLFAGVDWSDTALILLGDNGTSRFAQNPPFFGSSKGELAQGGINVPLIVRAPGAPRGADVHALVQVSDVFATVADLARVPIPSGVRELDSLSLAPYLNASYGAPTPRAYVYAELFEPSFVPVNGAPPAGYVATLHERAVRDAKYKLIEHATPGGTDYEFFRLYDPSPNAPPPPQHPALTEDPHELNDLMDSIETWDAETSEAFLELAGQLQTTYAPLPLN